MEFLARHYEDIQFIATLSMKFNIKSACCESGQ